MANALKQVNIKFFELLPILLLFFVSSANLVGVSDTRPKTQQDYINSVKYLSYKEKSFTRQKLD